MLIKHVFVSKDTYHLFYSSFSHTFSNFTLLVSCFKTFHPCITKKASEDLTNYEGLEVKADVIAIQKVLRTVWHEIAMKSEIVKMHKNSRQSFKTK